MSEMIRFRNIKLKIFGITVTVVDYYLGMGL